MLLHYQRYALKSGLQKVKTKTAIVIATVGLAVGSGAGLSLALLGSAGASAPQPVWQLQAPSSITFMCGGSAYDHTLHTVSEDIATGYFSGTGSYNADSSYTWTVNGGVSGNSITFKLVYTGSNANYTLDGQGTIASDGSIAGSVDNNCQTFSMPAGTAVATQLPGGRQTASVSFFNGGTGDAHWSRDMSHDTDPFSIVLNVPDNSSYAGINLHHTSVTLPAAEPSFDYYEQGSPSGGAPRLVIASTDGCYADEYVTPSVTGSWVTAGQWDVYGSCKYQYNLGWSGVQSVFKTKTVASVFIVSDAYNGGHTDWIDNIQYGGTTISQPSDNSNH